MEIKAEVDAFELYRIFGSGFRMCTFGKLK